MTNRSEIRYLTIISIGGGGEGGRLEMGERRGEKVWREVRRGEGDERNI